MNIRTRIVSSCHQKIHDVCNLAAIRTVLIAAVVALPFAVGAWVALERWTSLTEEFRLVSGLVVVLGGLAVGGFFAGRYLKRKPRDFDETRVLLVDYFKTREATVGEAWITFLTQPENCSISTRRRAWRKVRELDRQGYPGLIECVGPGLGVLFLSALLSVSISLLAIVGARYFDTMHASRVEIKSSVATALWLNKGDAAKAAKQVAKDFGLSAERAWQLQADFEAALKEGKAENQLDRLVTATGRMVPTRRNSLVIFQLDPTPTLTVTVLVAVAVVLGVLLLTLAAQAVVLRIHAPGLEAPEDERETSKRSDSTPGRRSEKILPVNV